MNIYGFKALILWLVFCGLITLTLGACHKRQMIKKTAENEASDEDVKSEELDIHGKDFVESKNLSAIHFDYDSSELSEDARKTLAANSEYLKKNPDLQILSEGHTDERGTIGYNLALGQKRAQAVMNYYISLGIPPKKIGSLSYGKEKPLCVENSEECWSRNRRVDTKIRASKVVNGNKDKSKNDNPVPEEEH